MMFGKISMSGKGHLVALISRPMTWTRSSTSRVVFPLPVYLVSHLVDDVDEDVLAMLAREDTLDLGETGSTAWSRVTSSPAGDEDLTFSSSVRSASSSRPGFACSRPAASSASS